MPAMPSEKAQQLVLQDQLEHHRRQQGEEQGEKTASAPKREEHREKSARAPNREHHREKSAHTPERTKGKPLAALFAIVKRKVA